MHVDDLGSRAASPALSRRATIGLVVDAGDNRGTQVERDAVGFLVVQRREDTLSANSCLLSSYAECDLARAKTPATQASILCGSRPGTRGAGRRVDGQTWEVGRLVLAPQPTSPPTYQPTELSPVYSW